MTTGDVFDTCMNILNEASLEEARFVCMELFAEVGGYETIGDDEIPENKAEKLIEAAKRCAQGEPVAYVAGFKCFYWEKYKVAPGVLIPRSDTEVLVEAAVKFAGCLDMPMGDVLNVPEGDILSDVKVVDLCTGTGCVGISLTNALINGGKNVETLLVEISDDAINLATDNIRLAAVNKDSISVAKMDVLNIRELPFKPTIITSNPPYITTDEMEELPSNVKDYEPELALEAGIDGLKFYIPIAKLAIELLDQGGALLVEHGFGQGEAVRKIFEEAGFADVMTIKDYGGNDRVTFGRKI